MASRRIPSVFVSSTCYDLHQVRADLKSFIESMGLDPVLSEYNSFPIDPDANTVENCRKAVEERADIFVLIVGGRYGSIAESGRSVTNVEYLQAKSKGIPVYVFVLKSILGLLPVWKDNPQADYKSVVDSPKLFEFVSSVRDSGVWVFPFENAQDITDTLRKQWAILFMDGLLLSTRAKALGLSESLRSLGGAALRLVIERPRVWEYRLLSQVWGDEMQKAEDQKRDLEYGIVFGKAIHLSAIELFEWLQTKTHDLRRLLEGFTQIMHVVMNDAAGPPGHPGDPEKLVYTGRKIGEAYRLTVEWMLELRRVRVDEKYRKILTLHEEFGRCLTRDIEKVKKQTDQTLSDVLSEPRREGHREIKVSFTFSTPDTAEIEKEFARLNQDLI